MLKLLALIVASYVLGHLFIGLIFALLPPVVAFGVFLVGCYGWLRGSIFIAERWI